MLVLFENLTPVCMLVIEDFQSSIAFTFLSYEIPTELGGALLAVLLDCDRLCNCCWKSHLLALYWSGGGAGSLPHVE